MSVTILLQPFLTANGEHIIDIDSSQRLEQWLDHQSAGKKWPVSDKIRLRLNSSVEFVLSPSLRFNYFVNATITIASMNNQMANIHCSGTTENAEFYPTRGIAFVNSTVTLRRLSFHNCGTYLKILSKQITDTMNTTRYIYSNVHAAAVLLVESKLLSCFVTFDSSFGFAVIGHNLIDSLFDHNSVYHSIELNKSREVYGSGVMIHFSNDDLNSTAYQKRVKFLHTLFVNNFDTNSHLKCENKQYYQPSLSTHIPIPNAAALTIIHARQYTQVTIDSVIFSHNIATQFGAMLVINLQNASTSHTTVKNSLYEKNAKFLKNNNSECQGDAVQFYWHWQSNTAEHVNSLNLLSFDSTTFRNHADSGNWNGLKYSTFGVVYIGIFAQNVSVQFTFNRSVFRNNANGNSCLMMSLGTQYFASSVTVVMTNTSAIENHPKQTNNVLKFENIRKAIFNGVSTFINNTGSALFGVDSSVYLNGTMTFTNNSASNGAGINIQGYSQLYLAKELKMKFVGNRVFLSGGAIYINVNMFSKCGFQTQGNSIDSVFINNTANTAGNSLFVSPLYKCINNGTYHLSWRNFLHNFFHLNNNSVGLNNTLLQISTNPIHFTINKPSEYPIQVYSGQTFEVNCSSKDQSNRHVFTLVNMAVYKSGKSSNNIWLTQFSGNQIPENSDGATFKMAVYTNCDTQQAAKLIMSVPNLYAKELDIVLKPCPLGFMLNITSGSCECSAILRDIGGLICLIDDRIMRQIDNIWIGTIDQGSVVAISDSCPFTYCRHDKRFRNIQSIDDKFVLINEKGDKSVPYCIDGRIGTLCGECDWRSNYSVVFGTSECKKCSNLSLLIILAFMFIGLVFIVVLYTFDLTLTSGKMNSVIFYAQLANAGLLEWFSLPYTGPTTMKRITHQCAFFILSFLNFRSGTSNCFYNGMNQIWKTGISGLAFPIYLLLVVLAIIIISRRSTWLSNKTSHNSIQVLVTVVHISFSEMLLTLISVYTPAKIHTPNGSFHVWYLDGSQLYLKQSHLLLAIIVTTIVSLFIVPYIAVLLFGNFFIRYSKHGSFYLRPILETLHTPYKKGKEHWFVGRLVFIIIIYLLYVSFRAKNTDIAFFRIAFVIALCFIVHTLFRPFKKKTVALLDSWLMLNMSTAYVSVVDRVGSTTAHFFSLVVDLALVTLLALVVCHIISMIVTKFFPNHLDKLRNYLQRIRSIKPRKVQVQSTDEAYYQSCNDYREPLIQDID